MRKKISSKVVRSVPLSNEQQFEYGTCTYNIHPKTDKSSSGRFTYTWKLHKAWISFDDACAAKFLDSFA